jgi:nicotinamide riboside transporter PnuC
MLYAISTSVQLGCNRVTFETDSAQLKTAAATEDYDLAVLGAIFRYTIFSCAWVYLIAATVQLSTSLDSGYQFRSWNLQDLARSAPRLLYK